MDSQSKKTLFQTILLIVFGLAAIIAIAIFAMNKGGSTSAKKGELAGSLTIWGLLPSEPVKAAFDVLQTQYPDLRITYVEKNINNLESDLTEALANGEGPDIFAITPEMIMGQRQRLLTIPYTSFPDSMFKQTFVDQANLFMTPEGIVAFPMYINPLVLYINNDILSTNYIVKNPTTWDELVSLAPEIVKQNSSGEISQRLIGLGLSGNTNHVLPIIATLLFQGGDPITAYVPGTSQVAALPGPVGESVFGFYTGFAEPTSDFYTNNSSLGNDRDMFIAGRDAFYIGFADELPIIRAKNPNLNFDVSMIPMPANGSGGRQAVFGQMTGWAITKSSKNPNLALAVLQNMSSGTFINNVLSGTWVAPARKDMVSVFPVSDNIRTMIYKSAIISKSFLNPDTKKVSDSLAGYISSVNNGSTISASAYNNWIADMATMLAVRQKP